MSVQDKPDELIVDLLRVQELRIARLVRANQILRRRVDRLAR